MEKELPCHFYPPAEERFNIISHGIGFALSILALVLLILKADRLGEAEHLVSFSIFGATMVLVYAASTFYHSARSKRLRIRLNILDHVSIYFLIAGTYTPFALITLAGPRGWTILVIVWILALVGATLKLFYAGRYQLFSTIMYVVMGWIIVFAIKPLVENLSTAGVWWLFGGGLSYTIGAICSQRLWHGECRSQHSPTIKEECLFTLIIFNSQGLFRAEHAPE